MREVQLCEAEGVRYVPDVASGVGALVLAGSSGRVDSARARVLAKHGALAESIQWFGGEGQHDGPWEIPIELFLDRVSELRIDSDRVIVLGTSFGSEAALFTGVLSDKVDAVVAFAPSDVVWAGVTNDGRVTSHWTHEAEALPFVNFADDWEPEDDPPAFVGLYERSRQRFIDDMAVAAIHVERIAHLVLVAGGDDKVWPSVAQAEAIRARRREHGSRPRSSSTHKQVTARFFLASAWWPVECGCSEAEPNRQTGGSGRKRGLNSQACLTTRPVRSAQDSAATRSRPGRLSQPPMGIRDHWPGGAWVTCSRCLT